MSGHVTASSKGERRDMVSDEKTEGIKLVLDSLLRQGTGSESDTAWFATVGHDDLIRVLTGYLNAHRHFLGHCHIERRQALNDRGVDLVVSAEGFRAGFQIKSRSDVADRDFSANVKRQFAEALSHDLDHYYLLICSPLVIGDKDYQMKIAHLLNELSLYRKVAFDAFDPLNTITVFKDPPTVSRDELLMRRAITDDCLRKHEKGYEHLPEIEDDEEVRRAEEHLDSFGDEWFYCEGGMEAHRRLVNLIHRKQAEQFVNAFVPTLPPDVREERTKLVAAIHELLRKCREHKHWSERSEYKLPDYYLDQVPEEMIPYTSIPNLLRIRQNLDEYLRYHESITQSDLEIADLIGRMSSADTAAERGVLLARIQKLVDARSDKRKGS